MKKPIVYLLGLLILLQIVAAGVTNPLPTELNLLKGESGRFKFQVQTVASNQEVECTSTLGDEYPLEVVFDPSIIIVPGGVVQDVYGTVTVPDEIDFGTYESNFCISCVSTEGTAGTSVKIDTCDLPIKVNVVDERIKDNMYIPPKPSDYTSMIIIIIGIVILVFVVFYLWKLSKKKPTKKKK